MLCLVKSLNDNPKTPVEFNNTLLRKFKFKIQTIKLFNFLPFLLHLLVLNVLLKVEPQVDRAQADMVFVVFVSKNSRCLPTGYSKLTWQQHRKFQSNLTYIL